MKYSAEQLSTAGDRFLGRNYDDMDCQEFIERCLREIGLKIDLKGSNAWYRKCLSDGWVGTPEDCVRTFGCVPKGAFLFIWADDGGEVKRGYTDGLGNASHIGLKTGRGKGAIHSSQSRGCVAESEFRDKTVPNGGWNRVGLWKALDYGSRINRILSDGETGPSGQPSEGGGTMQGFVFAENGKPVNLRKGPGIQYGLADRLQVGTVVGITGESGDWYAAGTGGKAGWIMKRFVRVAGEEGASSAQDTVRYTVTIPHLDREAAEILKSQYPQAGAEEER